MSEIEGTGVRLVGRDGRCRYDPSWKARLVLRCLEPGVSVSRQALDHGVNANLLRKWIKAFNESGALRPPAGSAFIPVHVADAPCRPGLMSGALEMPVEARASRAQGMAALAAPVKMSASLPNGVKLTLEAGDSHGLAAIIGALSDVQTGR